MSQVSNTNKIRTHHSYCVRVDRCDGPELIKCSPQGGYRTVAAAKEARIEEIQENMRFDLETISGLLNDIKDAKKQQNRMRLYCEINAFLNEIEKARKEQEKVRGLSLEDGSL
jgi:hypothetical protein